MDIQPRRRILFPANSPPRLIPAPTRIERPRESFHTRAARMSGRVMPSTRVTARKLKMPIAVLPLPMINSVTRTCPLSLPPPHTAITRRDTRVNQLMGRSPCPTRELSLTGGQPRSATLVLGITDRLPRSSRVLEQLPLSIALRPWAARPSARPWRPSFSRHYVHSYLVRRLTQLPSLCDDCLRRVLMYLDDASQLPLLLVRDLFRRHGP